MTTEEKLAHLNYWLLWRIDYNFTRQDILEYVYATGFIVIGYKEECPNTFEEYLESL